MIRPLFFSAAVLATALSLWPSTGLPDVLPDEQRPRIGLALGGGGARGAAHVGVLRVLEEQNIKVDYVAGTSMGAIVGALYALGLSADEIEQELLAVDWGELFEDRPVRRKRSMRRKDDDTESFFPVEFGLRGGWLSMPRGLIIGQKFAFAFPQTGFYTAGHGSFDNLPIPYRAVATDLESGEKVVLDHGNLIRAVRASMSIPGIFPPVEYDGRQLVDGYLTSNVPVDVVREMGADIVIAVEVGRRTEDVTPEELQTLGGIQEQAGRIQSQRALADELSRADIVIQPLLERWTGKEYDQLDFIIPPGEKAARDSIHTLADLGIDPVDFAAWRRLTSACVYTMPVVTSLELVNRTRIADSVILDRLDAPLGEPFDPDRLMLSFEEIHELGLVELSTFDLSLEGDETVLTVYVHEKPYAPYLAYIGGSYRMSYSGLTPLTLRLRINKLEVNAHGGEWRTDISVGSVFGIRSELYQPIDRWRRWFVAPWVSASLKDDALFLENRFIGDYRYHRALAGFDVGRAVGRFMEIRAGVTGGHYGTDWSAGILPIPERNDRHVGLAASLRIDTLDDHRLPHSGMKLGLHMESFQEWLGADVEYDRAWGHLLVARPVGRGRVLMDVQGGSGFGTGMPFYQHFYLGGLRSVSGYHINRLRGDSFGAASIGYMQRLGGSDLPFASKTHVGVWLDAGNTWWEEEDVQMDDLLYSAAVSLMFETPLGPLHMGYGRSDDGQDAIHLDFGVHIGTPVN
jgi:NTE family protein